jgi:hypothetical protein
MLKQCPSCFGRGYKPRYRKGKPGFYAANCARCNSSGQIDAPAFDLYWSPTGERIAQGIEARTMRAAIRKAPMPYRKFLGEIYAQEI